MASTAPPAPLMLAGLIGQPGAVATLRQLLARRGRSGAWLLVGAAGSGKRLAALATAQALLCEGQGSEGCGQCQPCQFAARGQHPDLVVVEPPKSGGAISIDVVRTLRSRVQLRPYLGVAHVVIILEAEHLTPEASDALLKTLEEPAGVLHLFLTTTAFARCAATLISRCQLVRFGPVPAEEIQAYLRNRAGLPVDEARRLARLANGSLGRALDGHRTGLAAALDAAVERLTDPTPWSNMPPDQLPLLLDAAIAWLRDVLRVQVRGAAAWHFAHREREVQHHARALSVREVTELLQWCLQMRDRLERDVRPNPKLMATLLRLRWGRLRDAARTESVS